MSDRVKVVLGGREFLVAELAHRTVCQDDFISSVFQAVGLLEITPTLAEDAEAYFTRVWSQLVGSGRKCEVLSAFLMPPGVEMKDWRREHGKAVQEHLERCNTEEDRQMLNVLAFQLIAGFFQQRLRLLRDSLSSSAAGPESPPPSQPAAQAH